MATPGSLILRADAFIGPRYWWVATALVVMYFIYMLAATNVLRMSLEFTGLQAIGACIVYIAWRVIVDTEKRRVRMMSGGKRDVKREEEDSPDHLD